MNGNTLAMLPWFPRDFITSTLGWRLLERALYRCLLDAQWELGALPDDHEELARIAGCTQAEFVAAWPRVSAKFNVDDAGRLFNTRLEEHRTKALKLKTIRVEAGRIGGRASVQSRKPAQAKLEANIEAKLEANIEAKNAASDQANEAAKSNPPSPSPSPSPSEESLSHTSPQGHRSSGAKSADVAKREEVSRGTRIPQPFEITEAMAAWAARSTPGLNLTEATAEFEDYWRGVPGAKGRKLDWIGTWRNRMRETHQRNKRSQPSAVSRYDLLTQRKIG